MFFNPFPMWFIILIIIPFQLFYAITFLPYYLLSLVGLGKWYGFGHSYIWEHIEQFTLQPKGYCKHIASINKQIIIECKTKLKGE